MKRFCDYHPDDRARWHCSPCQKHYCSHCMPDSDLRRRQGFCPKCDQAMRYLGDGEGTEPFWMRIPAFFKYPLHKAPLLVMAICTLVPAFLNHGVASRILMLLLLLALFKYTYAVINRTAEGKLDPPPLSEAFSGSGFDVIAQQVLVFFLMGALVTWAGSSGGPLLAFLAFAFVVMMMPASILILAMDRRVLAAVNPLRLVALVASLGWPYFVLYGHLILLMLASAALQEFALTRFPPWLGQPLTGLVTSYFLLVLFNMLGYLLLQYRDELGLTPEPPMSAAGGGRDRSRRRDADIDMALKDGQYQRAQQIIMDILKQRPDDARHLEQLYLLAMARSDSNSLFRQHRRLLPWMCRQRPDAVIPLLNQLLEIDPAFQLDDPGIAYQCAQVLYRHGEHRLLLQILKDFHLRFAEFDELANVYLLAAKALANGLQQWDKAGSFLRFIQARCHGHALQAVMPHYLAQAGAHQPLEPPAR